MVLDVLFVFVCLYNHCLKLYGFIQQTVKHLASVSLPELCSDILVCLYNCHARIVWSIFTILYFGPVMIFWSIFNSIMIFWSIFNRVRIFSHVFSRVM